MKSFILMGLFLSLNASADRTGTEGATQVFQADFEKVWNAALVALDDKTIESASKDVGQILTKAEKGHNFTGETSKSISVKISHASPCKVTVHSNIERTVSAGPFGNVKGTDTYSDDDQEKEILKAIEKSLK